MAIDQNLLNASNLFSGGKKNKSTPITPQEVATPEIEAVITQTPAEVEFIEANSPAYIEPVTQNRTYNTDTTKAGFKCNDFEPITARLDYTDVEILNSVLSSIKEQRRKVPNTSGLKRERITKNMVLRSLVKVFTTHCLERGSMDFSKIDNEEEMFRQISLLFKGVQNPGLNSQNI